MKNVNPVVFWVCLALIGPGCGDNPQTTITPTPACESDESCDDGLYCNGVETCDPTDGCQAGAAPSIDDGIDCTEDRCDEATDEVVHIATNSACDDGLFCNGEEVCSVTAGCVSGEAPELDDGVACTDDSCDEDTDTIVHTANDGGCDDGISCTEDHCNPATGCFSVPDDSVCGAHEVCRVDGGGCVELAECTSPDDPRCDDGQACTVDSCDMATGHCVNAPNDSLCDDGFACTTDRCDPVAGCFGIPDDTICDDGMSCTVDRCAEGIGCFTVPDDGLCAANETCRSDAGGCQLPPACNSVDDERCDDGQDCTIDSCDLETGRCVHETNDAACNDGLFCNGVEVCVPFRGCVTSDVPNCDDGTFCTLDRCNEETDTCEQQPANILCDDGLFCNGAEVCNVNSGCRAGAPPTIDDGVMCTDDSCDEENDTIINAVNHGNCDDGLFCNGVETCDFEKDCREGTPPTADDGVACTDDSCDEENDTIINAVNHGNCDDSLFCNGAETCDATNDCQAGSPPITDDGVACTDDSCDEDTDTIVNAVNHSNCDDGVSCTNDVCDAANDCSNTADDTRCDDSLFCNGVETCDATNDCQVGTPPTTDDGVACTDDSCDEDTDTIVNAVNHSNCDDGVSCTNDVCDAVNDCSYTADDTRCDDGLFCNGVETCDIENDCQVAADACVGGDACNAVVCNEESDACEEVQLCFDDTVDEVDFEAGSGSGGGLAFDGEQGGLVVSTGSTIDEDSLWVVNTAESSLSKWDAKTSTEVARYKVGLASGECLDQCCWNSGCNMPSRTVVDGRGDVYVASRGFSMQGTVTKVAGHIDDCVDRNNNGTIDTSTSATAMAFDTDECVLWTAPVGDSNAVLRALAIDTGDAAHPEGYPWAGGYNDQNFYKLNPDDGTVITTVSVAPLRPYGGVVLATGELWLGVLGGAQTGHFNTTEEAPTLTVVDFPTDIPTRSCTSSYGITADADGRVWFGGWGCGDAVAYDTTAEQWGHVRGEGAAFPYTAGRGITPDSEGRMWMALDGTGNGTASHVVWWNSSDLVLGGTLDVPTANIIDMPAGNSGPSALGFDKAGYLWLAHYSDPSNLLRIDPDTFDVDSYTGPNRVYSYTDFTGGVFRTVVANGFYDEEWDATCDTPTWGDLEWSATTPGDTFITFNVRTADTEAGLDDATPVLLAVLPPDESPGDLGDALTAAGETQGRFLRLTSFLQGGAGITPVLHNYSITWTCPAP